MRQPGHQEHRDRRRAALPVWTTSERARSRLRWLSDLAEASVSEIATERRDAVAVDRVGFDLMRGRGSGRPCLRRRTERESFFGVARAGTVGT
jgi:hypothetical protein